MNTVRLSATAARNKFFDLLNQVALGTEFIIEKDKKEVAVISPSKTKTDWEGLLKASKRVRGILKDYSLDEINPLIKKGAWKGFGEWNVGPKIESKSKMK